MNQGITVRRGLMAALIAGCGALVPAQAQTSNTTMAASGRDFEAQKVHKLGSLNADFLCERLFDSADPAGMTMELVRIVGPGVVLGKFPEIGGQVTAEQKQMYANLRVLARQKVWVPVSAERKMGEWMDQKYRKEGLVVEPASLARSLRPRYEMAKALLDGIVATLPADNPYTISLAVTQADESNASVSPGGFVYVTTGLLQDKTLDRNDIALRLSHEVAHLTRRHALKEVQVKVVDTLEITKSVKPLLDFAQEPTRVMETLFGTVKATELMFQRFDQVQELEGDACGTYLLARQSGVDAKAAVKKFAAARAGTGSKGWDASHPAPEERELVMNAQLDPALHARVAQLRTAAGSAPPVAGAKPAPSKPRAGASQDTNLNTLPATGAGPQTAAPTTSANPLGGLLEKMRSLQPPGGAANPTAGNPKEAP
jgi:hypothetical protein